MAALIYQCPHCLAEKPSLRIVGQSWGPRENYVHLSCPHCGMPSSAEIQHADGKGARLGDVSQFPYGLQQMGWSVSALWPQIPKPKLPEYLPDEVAKPYLAAEKMFGQIGLEEAAAGSYGRALDIGTKLYAPDLATQKLNNRIDMLKAQHRITPELADWSHHVKGIRNEAMHELEEITRDDLVAIRGFTEMLLTYLFTLPGMLEARKSAAAGSE